MTSPTMERQQVEYMRQKFQEMMASFDTLNAKIKQFEIEISKVTMNLDKVIAVQLEQANSLSKISKDLSNAITSYSEQNRSLKHEISQSVDTQKKNISDLAEVNAKCVGMATEISNCKAALQTKALSSDLPPLKKYIDDAAAKQMDFFDSLQKKHLDLAREQSLLKASIERNSQEISKIYQNEEKTSQEIAKHNQRATDFDSKINSLAAEIQRVPNHVNDQIAKIPKPQVQSEEDIKKMIIVSLEPVSLDAKNSVLRSKVNENKINVLEKKIENLNFQIMDMKGT